MHNVIIIIVESNRVPTFFIPVVKGSFKIFIVIHVSSSLEK